jgi:hypothetical protein
MAECPEFLVGFIHRRPVDLVPLGKNPGGGQPVASLQPPGLDQMDDLIHNLPENWFFIVSIYFQYEHDASVNYGCLRIE